jgi:hypothetical protein
VEEAKKTMEREKRKQERQRLRSTKHFKVPQGGLSVHECFNVCKQVSTILNTRNLEDVCDKGKLPTFDSIVNFDKIKVKFERED